MAIISFKSENLVFIDGFFHLLLQKAAIVALPSKGPFRTTLPAGIDELEPERFQMDMDKLPVYRFYQAARIHRGRVLSSFLPANDGIAAQNVEKDANCSGNH